MTRTVLSGFVVLVTCHIAIAQSANGTSPAVSGVEHQIRAAIEELAAGRPSSDGWSVKLRDELPVEDVVAALEFALENDPRFAEQRIRRSAYAVLGHKRFLEDDRVVETLLRGLQETNVRNICAHALVDLPESRRNRAIGALQKVMREDANDEEFTRTVLQSLITLDALNGFTVEAAESWFRNAQVGELLRWTSAKAFTQFHGLGRAIELFESIQDPVGTKVALGAIGYHTVESNHDARMKGKPPLSPDVRQRLQEYVFYGLAHEDATVRYAAIEDIGVVFGENVVVRDALGVWVPHPRLREGLHAIATSDSDSKCRRKAQSILEWLDGAAIRKMAEDQPRKVDGRE